MSDPRPPLPWRLLRSALFQLDAESAHHLAMAVLARWSRVCPASPSSSDVSRHPSLAREVLGLSFPNPLGLAAGFDKDARCVPAMSWLGFGFVEVGTVTWHAQPGNPRPRLFRLKADEALLNRLGFNNEGAEACARRLEDERARGRVQVPLGINLGKSKVVPNEEAALDYQRSFARLADLADYVVINVSSPNTPGLRELQEEDALRRVLMAVMDENARRSRALPVLLKLAPDLGDDAAHRAAEVAIDAGLRGLVISNTTLSREGLTSAVPEGSGGVSGRPLFARSTEMLRALSSSFRGRLAFIGVGGIMGPDDAKAKLEAGADLLQVYTGFIYGGAGFPKRVLRGLAEDPAALRPPSEPARHLPGGSPERAHSSA